MQLLAVKTLKEEKITFWKTVRLLVPGGGRNETLMGKTIAFLLFDGKWSNC